MEAVQNRQYRSSKSAMIPQNDTISQRLSQRMKSILGNVQHAEIEGIQVVKYEPSELFKVHADWFDVPMNHSDNPSKRFRSYNRQASIFAYLSDDCIGGETYFPHVSGVSTTADKSKFSITDTGQGLLVKPKKGNAVFWNNLHANGSGDVRVAHAGLPVESGVKIGLNLFSYYFYDTPMLGANSGL